MTDDAQVITDDEQADDWEHISVCAQRMIMAWDHVEMKTEAENIVLFSTDRQRAYILEALWNGGDDSFRARAWSWMEKRRAEAGRNENV
jgi:hypothetical protein